MTYLYFRDPQSDRWAVASVDRQGNSQVLETFDNVRLARARTLSLRSHPDTSSKRPENKYLQLS